MLHSLFFEISYLCLTTIPNILFIIMAISGINGRVQEEQFSMLHLK